MPTSYNATHSHRSPFPSIFHPLASVFFSHPCCYDHWAQPQWPASLRRFKRENGIIRKVFPRQFLRPRHREAFHEFSFAKTISCRACKRLLWHIRVSICLVGVFLSSDLSNFFLERRKSVSSSFLFEYACNWEIENCFSRSISCREREYIKNFSRDWERRIEFLNLSSFYLSYNIASLIQLSIIIILLIKRSHRKKPKLFRSYLDDQSHVSLNEHLRYQCDIRAWYAT